MIKKGFTLIELIVVIIVLGIIAIAAVPRIMNIGQMRLNIALEKVAGDLKYAHEFAMNHNCRSRVTFSDNSYTVEEDSSGSWQTARDPSTQDDFTVVLNTGNYRGVVIVSATFNGGAIIEFDPIGAPYTSSGNPLVETGSVVISGGGTERSINIAPVTGRIYVSE